jgi:8-oxo-dGTP diphosphatase
VNLGVFLSALVPSQAPHRPIRRKRRTGRLSYRDGDGLKERIRKLDDHKGSIKPIRLVVAALILRETPQTDGSRTEGTQTEILVCQRRANQPMSLKWEFPGGKIEPGETAEQALIRELDEELGIAAVIGPRVAQIRHKYRNGGAIDLQFFVVKEFSGTLDNRIFNAMQWSPLSALPTFDFLAADLGLIRDLSEGKLL